MWGEAWKGCHVETVEHFAGWLRDSIDIYQRCQQDRMSPPSQPHSSFRDRIAWACRKADELRINDRPTLPRGDATIAEAIAIFDKLLVATRRKETSPLQIVRRGSLRGVGGSSIQKQLDSAHESMLRRTHAEQEVKMREGERRRAKWSAAIQSTPSFDAPTIRACAEGLRSLVRDFKGGYEEMTNLHISILDLICESVKVGAFSGPSWLLWRTQLANRPHVLNALEWAKIEIDRNAWNDWRESERKAGMVEQLAALIESFAESENTLGLAQSRAGGVDDRPALSPRKQAILQSLLELQAFDSDSRRTTLEVAERAEGKAANTDSFKLSVSELKRAGFVGTLGGRGGGVWLSGEGRARAEALEKR